jgi:hypothetical protein
MHANPNCITDVDTSHSMKLLKGSPATWSSCFCAMAHQPMYAQLGMMSLRTYFRSMLQLRILACISIWRTIFLLARVIWIISTSLSICCVYLKWFVSLPFPVRSSSSAWHKK